MNGTGFLDLDPSAISPIEPFASCKREIKDISFFNQMSPNFLSLDQTGVQCLVRQNNKIVTKSQETLIFPIDFTLQSSS